MVGLLLTRQVGHESLPTLASVAGGQSGNALQITSGGYTYQSFSSVVNTRYLVSYYFKKVLRQAEH